MEISEARIFKVFSVILKKAGVKDFSTIAARLVDRLKEEYEIAGEEGQRIDATDTPVDLEDPDLRNIWDKGRPKVQSMPSPEPSDLRPPQPSKLVIGPEDPEFSVALHQDEGERRRSMATTGVRISRVSSPTGTPAKPVKYWNAPQVIEEIQKHCPAKIEFTPLNAPDSVKVLAVRDWENMEGMDMVRLKYYNPGVSGEGGVDMTAPASATPVVVPLIAIHPIYFTDRELDWDKAMTHIVDQLQMMYEGKISGAGKARRVLGDGEIGPSPIERFKVRYDGEGNPVMDGMSDQADIRRSADGWTIVADPQMDVLDAVIAKNKELGGKPK